ncbi:MAG: DMT family transporter [Anaerolineales bacterium]|nr:DMT family transporter [Anaerolineales bacterium]
MSPVWAMPATASLGRADLHTSAPAQNVGWADSLLVLTTVFWAVNFSVVKFALVELPPLAFNGLRMLLAAGLMLALVPVLGYSLKFQRHHLGRLIILGLLGNTSYQLCFIFGIVRTTADNAALILATVPAWVALIGTLAGTEKITFGGWVGVLLSLAGIVLIVWGGGQQAQLQFGGTTLPGDALILAATLCWSLYTLASRRLLRDITRRRDQFYHSGGHYPAGHSGHPAAAPTGVAQCFADGLGGARFLRRFQHRPGLLLLELRRVPPGQRPHLALLQPHPPAGSTGCLAFTRRNPDHAATRRRPAGPGRSRPGPALYLCRHKKLTNCQ